MELTIYHTNDIHSHFEEYLGIAKYLKDHQRDSDIYLDAGDFNDWLSPLVNGTDGLGSMRILKETKCDAIAIGNNEFFSDSLKLEKMSYVGVPMVSCNFFKLNGERLGDIKPSIIIEREGVRFLIIGSSPYWGDKGGTTAFMDMNGIRTDSPYELIEKEIKDNQGQYDICILLSHCGLQRDYTIAEQVQGIDIIIGGHSHTEMGTGEYVGNTFIHQSGKYADWLGVIDLEIEDKKIVSIKAKNIANNFKVDKSLEEIYEEEMDNGLRNLSEVLYELDKDLGYDPYRECPSVNAVADSLYYEYPCDLSLINNGILTGPISMYVSKGMLLEVAPSGLNPTSVYWYGYQIKEAIRKSFDKDFISQSGRGPGFRGHVLGAIAVSHNVEIDKETLEIRINGELLDDNRLYHVMSDDYLQRGTCYNMLGFSHKETEFYKGYIRDLLERTLNNKEAMKNIYKVRIK